MKLFIIWNKQCKKPVYMSVYIFFREGRNWKCKINNSKYIKKSFKLNVDLTIVLYETKDFSWNLRILTIHNFPVILIINKQQRVRGWLVVL